MEEGTALAKGTGQEQTWHLYLAAQSKEGWIFINSHGILETSYNLFKKRVHTQEVLLSFKDNYTAATNHHHRASLVPQMVKNSPAVWETWVRSLGWEDPLEEGMATHSSILAWRIPMDRGAWWATVHGVTKSRTQL